MADKMAKDAKAAMRCMKHNRKMIVRRPEIMTPGAVEPGLAYLDKMILVAKLERKNSRRAGRLSLKGHLKNLITAIVAQEPEQRHG